MNPLRLLVLLVSLPLLLGGCGEKLEVTDETKPKLKSVNYGELEQREGIYYLKDSDTPYTGKSFEFYDNGQKMSERNWKEGKKFLKSGGTAKASLLIHTKKLKNNP